MQLAADDAARQGQSTVTTDNMLVGLLRSRSGVFASFFAGTGTDMAKLRAMIEARLLPDADPLAGQELPADPLAESAVRAARAEAEARRRDAVEPVHLVLGILSQEDGPGARLLRDAGLTEAQLRDRWKGLLG
jgi:ATP-dependent Clp protease ATP-binding subunit ClpA